MSDIEPSRPTGEQNPITEPRPGQIVSKDQIVQGKAYLFRSASAKFPQRLLVSQPVTVLEGPQLSKTSRTFIRCRVDYTEEQLAGHNNRSTRSQAQTTMIVNLSDVGITEEGEFKPGTSIWLADPEEIAKSS